MLQFGSVTLTMVCPSHSYKPFSVCPRFKWSRTKEKSGEPRLLKLAGRKIINDLTLKLHSVRGYGFQKSRTCEFPNLSICDVALKQQQQFIYKVTSITACPANSYEANRGGTLPKHS